MSSLNLHCPKTTLPNETKFIALKNYFFSRSKANDIDFLMNLEIGVHSQKNASKSPKSKVKVQIRSGEEGPMQVTASIPS